MTCAKRRVRCTIISNDGLTVTGENECLSPQPVCPRTEDEGYEKCQTVCHQVGHAEEVALDKARAAGFNLPMTLAVVIAGHHRICGPCQSQIESACGVGTPIFFGKPWIS